MLLTILRPIQRVRPIMAPAVAAFVVIFMSVTVVAGERPDSFATRRKNCRPLLSIFQQQPLSASDHQATCRSFHRFAL